MWAGVRKGPQIQTLTPTLLDPPGWPGWGSLQGSRPLGTHFQPLDHSSLPTGCRGRSRTGQLVCTYLPAAGNTPAQRLWCAQPGGSGMGREWAGEVLFHAVSAGPLSGAQGVPDPGGLAHRPAKQEATLHSGQTPHGAAQGQEQEVGALGSKELGPAQYQVHPMLAITGAPGPLRSREGPDQCNGG